MAFSSLNTYVVWLANTLTCSLPTGCISLIINFASIDHVAGQFTAPPPRCPCDNITFGCTVDGGADGVTFWRLCGGSSSCTLLHEHTSDTSDCIGFKAMFESTSDTSFSSSLSGTATLVLDGKLVECIGPSHMHIVGNGTIQIIG